MYVNDMGIRGIARVTDIAHTSIIGWITIYFFFGTLWSKVGSLTSSRLAFFIYQNKTDGLLLTVTY